MLSSVFFRSRVLRALLGLTIACLGFATAADEVAVYTFDDEPAEVSANSGVLVLDQSGMNQNGTLYSGAELFKEGDDGALQLNGGTGFAKMILRKTRFDTAPFSVEFNILLDSLKDGMVMGKKLAEEPDAAGWVVETANKAQEIHFTFSDGQQSDALSVPLKNPQEWSHVVMVRDGKTVTVYVNGQLAGSKTSPVFGKDLQSPGDYFYLGKILGKLRSIHGKLDEVIIRNGSLTAEEVEKAYRAAKDKNIKKKRAAHLKRMSGVPQIRFRPLWCCTTDSTPIPERSRRI